MVSAQFASRDANLLTVSSRWQPFDVSRNWPDLGPRFISGERLARQQADPNKPTPTTELPEESVTDDRRDLDWSAVIKRTLEAYVRGETPNMYGEWIQWS